MLIIPAIDLLGNECVRLVRGNYDEVTRYSKHPGAVARQFEEAGARLIHIVDLDRARGAKEGNRAAIREIRKHVDCALEVGGGVRSEEDIAELLECGVERVIIGTALVREPERVALWIAKFNAYAIAGLDASNRQIRISGWTDEAGKKDTAVAKKLAKIGIREIIYTTIEVDGTLAGPDIKSTTRIARAARLPVILSGGIGSEADVAGVVAKRHPGVKGVIVGKALYEEKVSLARLISLYQRDDDVINEVKGKY